MVHLGLRKNSPPQKDLNTRRRGGYPEQKLTSTSTQNPGALHQAKPAWASPSHAASVAVSSCSHQPCPSWTGIRSVALSTAGGGAGLRFLLTPRRGLIAGFCCISPGLRPPFPSDSSRVRAPSPSHTKSQSTAYFSPAGKKNLCLLSFDFFFFLPGPVHWRRRSVHTLEARGS